MEDQQRALVNVKEEWLSRIFRATKYDIMGGRTPKHPHFKK
jgi:hypothetical protein